MPAGDFGSPGRAAHRTGLFAYFAFRNGFLARAALARRPRSTVRWAMSLLPNLMCRRRMAMNVRKAVAVALLASLLVGVLPAGASTAGPAVTIAVLDTGVDATHPELAGRVTRMSFYQSPVPVQPPIPGVPNLTDTRADPDGHGTAAASVAAAKTFGVAPAALILDMQVNGKYLVGPQGVDSGLDPAAEGAAMRAMDELLQHHGGANAAGPRIALLSFAGNLTASGAATLAAQAHDLWADGVLVIVPAGPATALQNSPYVLTIGMQRDSAACGKPMPSSAVLKPDLVAAGKNVKVATPPATPTAAGGIGSASGSAFAAAAVAGAAALMWQANKDLPVAAVQAILRDTALSATGPNGCDGFGSLVVIGALSAAQTWSDPIPPGTPSATSTPMPAVVIVLAAVLALAARRR